TAVAAQRGRAHAVHHPAHAVPGRRPRVRRAHGTGAVGRVRARVDRDRRAQRRRRPAPAASCTAAGAPHHLGWDETHPDDAGECTMADASMDIVSKVDRQEVDNALNQAVKEINQRYDFKNVGASIAWSGTEKIVMIANSEDRVMAILDVFQTKL